RNRIIAGLSAGVVVVEASRRSGSLITARLASDFGRDVFAVPGSVFSATSVGTHGLLRRGAILCRGAGAVLAQLLCAVGRAVLPVGDLSRGVGRDVAGGPAHLRRALPGGRPLGRGPRPGARPSGGDRPREPLRARGRRLRRAGVGRTIRGEAVGNADADEG